MKFPVNILFTLLIAFTFKAFPQNFNKAFSEIEKKEFNKAKSILLKGITKKKNSVVANYGLA